MGDLHELARSVTVYHNSGDLALHVSDCTAAPRQRTRKIGPGVRWEL